AVFVAHIITRLIIGGAQENTLLTVEDQVRDYGDRVALITGPGLGPEGSLEERAHRSGAEMHVIPQFRRNIHPYRDWSSYRALIQLLQELKPDLVHTHASKAGILGRWAAARVGIPAVHTIHGASFHYGQSTWASWLYQKLEQNAAKSTARFISVADAMTDQYVAAGIAPRDRFVTISSGFDVDPFLTPPRDPAVVRKELGLGPEHIVIGKIARLFHLKGHEFLIAAAGVVAAQVPNVRFLLVGDGILRDEFERKIAAAGLTEHFVFAGLVPPTRIPELIHAMDIVVHTSLWEGLARVLPQGLIAGKPVISYDVDGAREVVLPGETGYLLPPQSIEPLSQAMIELASNADLRARFGATGRAKFADQFRHQTMTRRIREVYAEVLAPRQ
ncbi:MAG: glycosyltransferase family 4 protein, partial [Planctomycetaceae bacterium]|nr:glycosyltransferase family 4 protein [Planctomycetaceae bacterium]